MAFSGAVNCKTVSSNRKKTQSNVTLLSPLGNDRMFFVLMYHATMNMREYTPYKLGLHTRFIGLKEMFYLAFARIDMQI